MKSTINIQKIREYISKGWITEKKHPIHDIFIYNYSQKTQFEYFWDTTTIQCRGLILNKEGFIHARPFQKFFNLSEHQGEIPNEAFEVFEKMDGSLGILYWLENEPYIATRGSFESCQAKFANQLLRTKYRHIWQNLNPKYTYLFEIIYPENRIVVDYGADEKLVLLAIIDTQTGQDIPLKNIGFPLVKKYSNIKNITGLSKENKKNAEGYVLRFESGLRLKIKFDEYIHLHKIYNNISSLVIWNQMKNESLNEKFLAEIPDEIYPWIKEIQHKLEKQYSEIENLAKQEYKEYHTRKETAEYFKTCKHPSILFSMLNGKSYSEYIWKLIRPNFEKPKITRK
ncbi:MAG: hypothetical protein N4A45_01370 [Flavobacteriales bacterium]|jgi:RNA ligase|nr:hypothetical protein [Flavobacteriales bacterium]